MATLKLYTANGQEVDLEVLLRRVANLEVAIARLADEVQHLRAQRMQIGTPRTQPVPYPDPQRLIPLAEPPMADPAYYDHLNKAYVDPQNRPRHLGDSA